MPKRERSCPFRGVTSIPKKRKPKPDPVDDEISIIVLGYQLEKPKNQGDIVIMIADSPDQPIIIPDEEPPQVTGGAIAAASDWGAIAAASDQGAHGRRHCRSVRRTQAS